MSIDFAIFQQITNNLQRRIIQYYYLEGSVLLDNFLWRNSSWSLRLTNQDPLASRVNIATWESIIEKLAPVEFKKLEEFCDKNLRIINVVTRERSIDPIWDKIPIKGMEFYHYWNMDEFYRLSDELANRLVSISRETLQDMSL